MDTWIDFRDEYMDELMRSEGPGDFANGNCAVCVSEHAIFRCRDCIAGPMWCLECVLLRHNQNPLHRLEVLLFFFALFYPVLTILFYRDGMGYFLSARHCKSLDYMFSLATLPIASVRAQSQVTKISSSFIQMVSIMSRSTTAAAQILVIVNNSCDLVGTLPPLWCLKPAQ